MDTVLDTVVLVLTVEYGSVLFIRNLLERFGTAVVAGIGVDEEEWFHLRHASNDATNSDKLAQVDAFNVSHSHRNVREKWPEV